MNFQRLFIFLIISSMVLVSCGESGSSQSGSGGEMFGAQRAQQSISCQRQGQKKVVAGSQLIANFDLSQPYQGPASITTLCELDIVSQQNTMISQQTMQIKTALPDTCAGLKTYTVVLSLPAKANAEPVMGMCSWSQNIISPILEADIREKIASN